jgi:hypothetical protein
MGISEIRLVKTLIHTAFSGYGKAVTACDRLFQRFGRPSISHWSTFQPFLQPMAQNWRINTKVRRIIRSSNKKMLFEYYI